MICIRTCSDSFFEQEDREAPRRGTTWFGVDTVVQENWDVWGDYPNYQDIARLEYARILWKNAGAGQMLLGHWSLRALVREIPPVFGDFY